MNIEEFKNSIWVKDFLISLTNAHFLLNLNDDTSRRQAFVLLDNLFERFLKNYLIKVVKIKTKDLQKNGKIFFEHILKVLVDKLPNYNEVLNRVLENHETRNDLYHSPINKTISKEQFNFYYNDIEILCYAIGLENISSQINIELEKLNNIIFNKNTSFRKEKLLKLENLIKKQFDIPSEIYEGDIFLGSTSNNICGALDSFKNFLFGILQRKDQYKTKARILEIIEQINNLEYHSFLISYFESSTWFCFYRIFSYKRNQKLRINRDLFCDLIENNKESIDYKKCRYDDSLDKIFDPIYLLKKNGN